MDLAKIGLSFRTFTQIPKSDALYETQFSRNIYRFSPAFKRLAVLCLKYILDLKFTLPQALRHVTVHPINQIKNSLWDCISISAKVSLQTHTHTFLSENIQLFPFFTAQACDIFPPKKLTISFVISLS